MHKTSNNITINPQHSMIALYTCQPEVTRSSPGVTDCQRQHLNDLTSYVLSATVIKNF